MATIITKTVVCDIGGKKCGTSKLEPWRIGRDSKAKSLILCPKHAAPVQRLWDLSEASVASVEKGGLMTMDEIEVLKKQQSGS